MKFYLLLISLLVLAVIPVKAQDAKPVADQEAEYTRTITTRARKIVTALNISDAEKADRITEIIALQYRNLNTIHADRDEKIKSAKTSGAEKSAIEAAIKNAEDDANVKLAKLHDSYLLELSAELSPSQVEQVKDGMTYGVLPITYRGYLDMLQNLTDEQKLQIRKWLEEAREHAMDAESSEKKHWWFGKYKGRINNYLSAAGYDMKKEGEEWQKRIKAREAEKKGSKN
ncbi:MAG TPA: DUF3826 domain-containing protein [Chitinophagaceae bacterium]